MGHEEAVMFHQNLWRRCGWYSFSSRNKIGRNFSIRLRRCFDQTEKILHRRESFQLEVVDSNDSLLIKLFLSHLILIVCHRGKRKTFWNLKSSTHYSNGEYNIGDCNQVLPSNYVTATSKEYCVHQQLSSRGFSTPDASNRIKKGVGVIHAPSHHFTRG